MTSRRAVRLSDQALKEAAQYPIGTWVAIRYERVIGSGSTRAEAQAQAPGAKHIYQVKGRETTEETTEPPSALGIPAHYPLN